MPPQSTDTNSNQPPSNAEQKQATEIDIEKLADKVYRLMQADLRLTHVRGAMKRQNGKKRW
jgi:hypothetical protein